MKIKYKIPTSLEHTWPIIVRYIALLGLVIAIMSTNVGAAENVALGITPSYVGVSGNGWGVVPNIPAAVTDGDFNTPDISGNNGIITQVSSSAATQIDLGYNRTIDYIHIKYTTDITVGTINSNASIEVSNNAVTWTTLNFQSSTGGTLSYNDTIHLNSTTQYIRYIRVLYGRTTGAGVALFGYTWEIQAYNYNWWSSTSTYRINAGAPSRYGTVSLNLSNSCGTNNATWVFGCGLFNYSFTDNYTVQTNIYFIDDNGTSLPLYFKNISGNNSIIYTNYTTLSSKQIYINTTNRTFNNSAVCTDRTVFRFCNDFEGSSITGNWSALAGTLTQTGNGYLRYVSNTGNFQRASSAYNPDSFGSWSIISDIGVESTVDGYAYIGQTGTDTAASGASAQISFGNTQGNASMVTHIYNTSATDTGYTTAASFWDQPTRINSEIRKQPGTVQAYIYTLSNNFVESKTTTTNVPNFSNPLGLYNANNLPQLLYFFAVSDYNTSDSAFTTWSNTQSLYSNTVTNDQTLNFTVTIGAPETIFYLNSTAVGNNTGCNNSICPWWRINGVTQSGSQGSASMSTAISENSTITVVSIDSSNSSFTTTWIVNVTNVPTLVYPLNGTTIAGVFPPITQDVNFSWYGSGATHIQVASDTSFNVIEASITTSNNYSLIGLSNGTHYWRARYYNTTTSTYGDFSNYESFIITTTTPSLSGTVLNGVVYEYIGGVQTPVSGASVYLTNSTDTLYFLTGANGYYQFSSVASTTYSIYAIKQGYDNSQVFTVTPVSGATNTLNIPMRIYISPYVPNFVFEKFVVRSLFDDPYVGVTVNIFVNGNAAPSFSGVTDSMGQVVFQLVKDTYYRAEFSGGGLSSTVTVYFYGKEEVYLLSIASGFPTGGDKNTDINATLFVTQINATHANLSLYYSDNSSTTTSINFYATYYLNDTSACATQNTAVYPVTLNCTVVMNNLTYQFGYNSTSSKYGLSQKDKIVNFAANNASAPQIIGNRVDSNILNWLSIIGLIFVAGLFSVKTNKFGVVVVPMLAEALYWFGALNVSGELIHMALVIGILVYIRMSEPKVAV